MANPLADVLRPSNLDEIIGQQHLVGPGMPLRLMVDKKYPTSAILWGTPGVGKTSVVRAMCADVGASFQQLNATSAKVDDIRKVLKTAEIELLNSKRTILFIDEIHRFPKNTQDVLLPGVEKGTIVLFGATTEKPKFAVNSTLLSRCMVWELKPLKPRDLMLVLKRVKDWYAAKGRKVAIQPEAAKLLINRCSGDARKLITVMETIVEVLSDDGQVTEQMVNTAFPEKHIVFDSTGNEHFDLAAAYQNSVQNSDTDGAIYWLAKWLHSGEDPAYIARRMLVTAFEDCATNLLIPGLVAAAHYTTERVGMPECAIALGQATVAMCQSERSRVGYRAIRAALDDVERGANVQVPPEMRAGAHGGHSKTVTKTYANVDVVQRFYDQINGKGSEE